MGGGGDYKIQSTKFLLNNTCNERRVNRVHLNFSLYTDCLNRPCGKELNTTALVNLNSYNVYVNIILWRNLRKRLPLTSTWAHPPDVGGVRVVYCFSFQRCVLHVFFSFLFLICVCFCLFFLLFVCLFFLPVSCMDNVSSVSGFFIVDFPFGFL